MFHDKVSRDMSHYSWLSCQCVSAARLAVSEKGKGTRKTREWSSAKMARESEVLILLRGGYRPLLFQPKTQPATQLWHVTPDHTLLENVQILVTPAHRAFSHFDDFLPIYRVLLFPHIFRLRSFFNTRQFYNDEAGFQWSSVFDAFCFVKPVYFCV